MGISARAPNQTGPPRFKGLGKLAGGAAFTQLGETPARVRAASAADVSAVARIQLRAALYSFAHIFPDSVPKPTRSKLEQDWAALLAGSETAIRVALLGEVVVGVVAYGADPALTPPGYGHLARLYVDPDHAGQGIGGALHDLALVGLAAAGWSRGWLWVLEGNSRARGMYEKRGWEARHARRTDWPGSGVFEMSYARLL